MASKQIQILATRADLEPGIRLIEAKYALKYALCGLFRSPDVRVWRSLLDAATLGIAAGKSTPLCDAYLVLPADIDLKVRDVPQDAGGTMYSVDQRENPASITFEPGGMYGEKFLIAGCIGTISDHPLSIRLYQDFRRCVTKGFKRYPPYHVGAEACQLQRRGVRLITYSIDKDERYDLKCDS